MLIDGYAVTGQLNDLKMRTCAIEGIFPAPKAAAFPGRTRRQIPKTRRTLPRDQSDAMMQPYE